MKTYDLIIIGGGSGGLTAASGAAQFGASVALIEKKNNLGGDCLHAGCVPSKAFITVGKEIHQARKAAEQHNMQLTGDISLARVNRRVHDAIDDIQEMDDVSRFEEMGVDVFLKEAVFTGPHTVQLGDGEEIEGKRIVIATGSKAVIPPIDNIEALPYFTNETIFDAEELPGHIVCVGGGPVGVELAQVLARLGAKVTIVDNAPRLFPNEEEEIGRRVQSALLEELNFVPNARVEAIEEDKASGLAYAVLSNGEKIKADALLIAAGRRPNTGSLQLDKAGIDPAKDGSIPVKPTLQTKAPHIYAVGDVTGEYAFTHAAGLEGQIVVTNAVFGLRRRVSYSTLPWVFYTEPELFRLGLTEQQAREKHGDSINVYKVNGGDVDRFIAERDKTPLVKIITDKRGKILGAHAAGKNASDWMHEVVAAKAWKKPLRSFSSIVYPYPSRGEILKKAADIYWREKLFDSSATKLLKKYVKTFR